jgi:hypothetical protein
VSETDVSRGIREALRSIGWTVERLQCGRVKVSGGWMHLCSPGTPDLLCMRAPGIVGFIETKVPKTGILSDIQIAWHAWAKKAGINADVAISRQAALNAVKGWN